MWRFDQVEINFKKFIIEQDDTWKLSFIDNNVWTHSKSYIFLTQKDNVYCFGQNNRGQLGQGHNQIIGKFCSINELNGKCVIEVLYGNFCTLAKTTDNSIYAWGTNETGQLGNGKDSAPGQFFTPQRIEYFDAMDIVQISTGDCHNLALSSDGQVYGWGDNYLGQIAATDEGSVGPSSIEFPDKTKIKWIVCFSNSSFAISNDNQVYFWGKNHWFNLKCDNPEHINRPVLIPGLIADKLICSEDTLEYVHQNSTSTYKNNETIGIPSI